MTKKIRIENADTSPHKAVVEIWEKNSDKPDRMIFSVKLDNPADMVEEIVNNRRYLIIKEY